MFYCMSIAICWFLYRFDFFWFACLWRSMSIEVLVGMNKNTVSLCKQFFQSVIQSFYVIQTCFPFLIKEEERKEKKKKIPQNHSSSSAWSSNKNTKIHGFTST